MKHFRLLGLAMLAVFALGATLSSSAFALPELLGANAFPQTFTDKTDANNPTLETANHKVTCEKATSTGTQETDTLGKFHISFTKCTSTLNSVCTSTGDASGEILTLGSFHYVLDEKSGIEDVAILFLIGQGTEAATTFTCEAFGIKEAVEVKGTLLCLILLPLKSEPTHLFHCTGSKGVPGDKEYLNDENKSVKALLLTKVGGGVFEESNEVALAEVTFKEAVAFMNE
jgi:hypothetical protein